MYVSLTAATRLSLRVKNRSEELRSTRFQRDKWRLEGNRLQKRLRFLRNLDRETPEDKTLHLICDIYATHRHPNVQERLQKYPCFNMYFMPTSASWLNMVERFFRDISENYLRRGVFTRVPELTAAIDEYIAHH